MSNDTIQAISRSLSADIATLNTISHNIANSNTHGYRAERSVPSFQAHVDNGGTRVAVDQKDGPLALTGRALDVALRGEGFFSVERGGETILVRAGNFRIDTDGRLVTSKGEPVLGTAGALSLKNDLVRIDAKGQIWSGEDSLGQLKLSAVADPSLLQPVDGGFRYAGALDAFKGSVHQGAIEQTNVNVADESIRLMELTRHVESVQRAISIYDKAMDTGINRLGEN